MEVEAFVAAMVGTLLPAGHATAEELERLQAIGAPYLRDRFNFDGLPEPDPGARLYHERSAA